MPASSIGTVLNNGYLGQISVNALTETSARPNLPSTAAAINFGDAVVLNSDSTGGTWSQAAAVLAAAGAVSMTNFAGFAIREVKQFTSFTAQNGVVGYQPGDQTDVILRGIVNVACLVGTPQAGKNAYLRIALNVAIPAGVLGGIEAAADSTNTILLTNVKFHSGVLDGNNVTPVKLITANF